MCRCTNWQDHHEISLSTTIKSFSLKHPPELAKAFRFPVSIARPASFRFLFPSPLLLLPPPLLPSLLPPPPPPFDDDAPPLLGAAALVTVEAARPLPRPPLPLLAAIAAVVLYCSIADLRLWLGIRFFESSPLLVRGEVSFFWNPLMQ